MIVASIAMLIAVPLGLASALYLSEYARPARPPRAQADRGAARRHPQHRGRVLRAHGHQSRRGAAPVSRPPRFFNLMAAGIGVGILSMPLVATVAEDALRAVPAFAPRGVVRARRAASDDEPAGRRPGGDLGDRGRDHPGPVACHRRDDGRRSSRRAARAARRSRSIRFGPGQTATGGDGRARHRHATR